MLPSLFTSDENARPWSVPRAALYGAGIGLLAALIKFFGPFHAAGRALPVVLEIAKLRFSALRLLMRRRRAATQSAGTAASGHATLKAVITDRTARRYSPASIHRMGIRPTASGRLKTSIDSACGCVAPG